MRSPAPTTFGFLAAALSWGCGPAAPETGGGESGAGSSGDDGGGEDGGGESGGDEGGSGGDTGAASLSLSLLPVDLEGDASGADLDIAPDGELYVSFVRKGHVWLTSSTDQGETWSEPIWVDGGGGSPQVYDVSHPNLDVGHERIAVAKSGSGHQYLFIGDRGAGAGEFEMVELDAINSAYKYEAIFVKAHITPAGEVWASSHAFPKGEGWTEGWKGIAQEGEDFVLEPASTGAPGEPCECCPQDLLFTQSGRTVLAYRNNVDDLRDITVATSPTFGPPDAWQDISDNGWEISYCPVQGPRLVEDADGVVHAAWSDAVTGSGEIYTARSADDGATWTSTQLVLEDPDTSRVTPTFAAGEDGRLLLTWSAGLAGSVLAWSDDGGETWQEHGALESEAGALRYLELDGGAGFLGGAAADTAGQVWLVRVD